MIWLYLGFVLAGSVGLVLVVVEWNRGVGKELLGPFVTFGLMLTFSALGILSLHSMDGGRPAALAHPIASDATFGQQSGSLTGFREPLAPSQDGGELADEGTGGRRPSLRGWSRHFVRELLPGILSSLLSALLYSGLQGLRRAR